MPLLSNTITGNLLGDKPTTAFQADGVPPNDPTPLTAPSGAAPVAPGSGLLPPAIFPVYAFI